MLNYLLLIFIRCNIPILKGIVNNIIKILKRSGYIVDYIAGILGLIVLANKGINYYSITAFNTLGAIRRIAIIGVLLLKTLLSDIGRLLIKLINS